MFNIKKNFNKTNVASVSNEIPPTNDDKKITEQHTPEKTSVLYDVSKEISEKMKEFREEFLDNALSKMALVMRSSFVLNNIYRSKEKIELNLNEDVDDFLYDKAVNWDKVNQILFTNILPFEYNLSSSVNSIKELEELRLSVIMSMEMSGPWWKGVCKDCGEEIILSYKEAEHYKEKGFSPPKRCKKCKEEHNLKYGKGNSPILSVINRVKNGCFIKIFQNGKIVYDGPVSEKIKQKVDSNLIVYSIKHSCCDTKNHSGIKYTEFYAR